VKGENLVPSNGTLWLRKGKPRVREAVEANLPKGVHPDRKTLVLLS
jgi:hypothetical protein